MPSFDYKAFFSIDNELFKALSSMPNALARICVGLFVVAACFMLLPIKKAFFEQCAGALLHEPLRVITNGAAVYFILIFASALFLFSVVGFPIAAFFMLCGGLCCLLGEIAAGIWLGCFFTDKINIVKNTYSNLAFGVIIIEMLKLLPYAGRVFSLALFPVVCLGAVTTGAYNALVRRTLYDLPYWREGKGAPAAVETHE